MNKLKSVFVLSMFSALFLACNQSATTNSTATTKDIGERNTSVPFTNVVMKDPIIHGAYKNYINLKNSLVASNIELAQKSASDLSGSLSKIDGCENTASIATKIANSQNLKDQRTHFTTLSADFIALLKHADVKEGTLYVQYCPMANSGKGGSWLASSSEINNPYYGDEMLNCGEVKETITSK